MIRGLSQPSLILAAITPRSWFPHSMSQSGSILLQPQLQMNSLATSVTTRARAGGAHSQVEATQARITPARRARSLTRPLGGGKEYLRASSLCQRMPLLHGGGDDNSVAPVRPHHDDDAYGHNIGADPHPNHQRIDQRLDGGPLLGIVGQDEVQVLPKAAQDPHHRVRLLRAGVKPLLGEERGKRLSRVGDMDFGP